MLEIFVGHVPAHDLIELDGLTDSPVLKVAMKEAQMLTKGVEIYGPLAGRIWASAMVHGELVIVKVIGAPGLCSNCGRLYRMWKEKKLRYVDSYSVEQISLCSECWENIKDVVLEGLRSQNVPVEEHVQDGRV